MFVFIMCVCVLFYLYRAIRARDYEIKKNRLTEEELEAKKREKVLADQRESEQRKEKSRQVKEAMKQQEIDDLKPKARSALAARWEERIKARSEGKITRESNKATVLSGGGMHVSQFGWFSMCTPHLSLVIMTHLYYCHSVCICLYSLCIQSTWFFVVD